MQKKTKSGSLDFFPLPLKRQIPLQMSLIGRWLIGRLRFPIFLVAWEPSKGRTHAKNLIAYFCPFYYSIRTQPAVTA
jgi:hypothetical protein